jgi:hypothetical protein
MLIIIREHMVAGHDKHSELANELTGT